MIFGSKEPLADVSVFLGVSGSQDFRIIGSSSSLPSGSI